MSHSSGITTKPKRFHVAFSFPGEQRDYVEPIARILADRFGEEAMPWPLPSAAATSCRGRTRVWNSPNWPLVGETNRSRWSMRRRPSAWRSAMGRRTTPTKPPTTKPRPCFGNCNSWQRQRRRQQTRRRVGAPPKPSRSRVACWRGPVSVQRPYDSRSREVTPLAPQPGHLVRARPAPVGTRRH